MTRTRITGLKWNGGKKGGIYRSSEGLRCVDAILRCDDAILLSVDQEKDEYGEQRR